MSACRPRFISGREKPVAHSQGLEVGWTQEAWETDDPAGSRGRAPARSKAEARYGQSVAELSKRTVLVTIFPTIVPCRIFKLGPN